MNDTVNVRPLRRALVSVFDKTGLPELAAGLAAAGVDIVSTGSTAATIREVGVKVTEVADVTGFPECFDGRVKTLHPRIHAGILADTTSDEHVKQLAELNIETFDLVICNLYPFEQTVASGAPEADIIEKIDIGGPSMVRAAAKNHLCVAVVVDPQSYPDVLDAATAGGFTVQQRRRLAAAAFAHTAAYDAAVAEWSAEELTGSAATPAKAVEASTSAADPTQPHTSDMLNLPTQQSISLHQLSSLRYGENSHQVAALYSRNDAAAGLAQAEVLHGKPMSYNNYVDTDAALRTAYDFDTPAVAIIKHANPCGVARADSVEEAYLKAHACDPVSAFGGVIAANREVTEAMAKAVAEVFTEVIIAPSFSAQALEILTVKKNIRVIALPEGYQREALELRQVSGGMLLQGADRIDAAGDDPQSWQLVAGEKVSAEQFEDLVFAWRAVRTVKSNAILLAADNATVGIGMGQVNRLDSSRLAIQRANSLAADAVERARGSVAASDAFFPFADGLQILIDAGVSAVVQPGGSQRDSEVIDAAQTAGISMYLTGTRHFFH